MKMWHRNMPVVCIWLPTAFIVASTCGICIDATHLCHWRTSQIAIYHHHLLISVVKMHPRLLHKCDGKGKKIQVMLAIWFSLNCSTNNKPHMLNFDHFRSPSNSKCRIRSMITVLFLLGLLIQTGPAGSPPDRPIHATGHSERPLSISAGWPSTETGFLERPGLPW